MYAIWSLMVLTLTGRVVTADSEMTAAAVAGRLTALCSAQLTALSASHKQGPARYMYKNVLISHSLFYYM